MRTILIVGLAAIGTTVEAQTNTADGLMPGAWASTFAMQMAEINGQKLGSTAPEINSETDCYTTEDVADARRILLAGAEKVCAVSDFSMAGGKVRLSAKCTFAAGMTLTGDFQGSYSTTAFSLSGTLRTPDGVPKTAVNAAMSARRVGVCHASQ